MKRITLILTAMLFGFASFSQNYSAEDLQKLQIEREAQFEKEMQKTNPKFLAGTPGNSKSIDCMEDATYSNPPVNFETGVTSNIDAGYIAAHKVEGFDGSVQAIRFFGIQAIFVGSWMPMNDFDPYDFEITFFEDSGGLPGAEITSIEATINHINTGELFAGSYNVYYWDFEPEAIVDGLPETFWVAAANTNPEAWFLWINQVGGLGAAAQYSMDDGAWSHSDVGSFGICIVPMLAEDDAPGVVTDFSIEAASQGVLEATVSWTNPAIQADGETLTELTSVMVERDNEVIHTISNPAIGGAETFVDTDIDESGTYSYQVYGVNSAGEGLKVSGSVYVGEDLPGAPQDVLLTADGNNGVITWNAPTEGLNGGYFDDSNLTYTVVRFPDEVEVATDIVEEAFTDTTVPGIGNYLYAVTASNDMGEGGTAESNAALLGADGYLIFEGFEDEWPPVGWTNNGWTLSTYGQPHTGNEFAYSNLAGSTLKTPVVILPEGSAYNLEFYFRAESANFPQDFDVRISVDGGDFTNIFSVTGYDVATYEEVNLSLAEYSGSAVQIKFVGLSGAGGWAFGVLLDDVSVYMPFDNDLEGVSISGNTTPSAGVQSTYTIGVFNAGAFAQSDYTVKLMQEGDVEIASVEGQPIEPGETISYELQWTPMEEGPTYLYGYVDFPEDEAPGNNQTPNLNVVVQPSDMIVVTIGTSETFPPVRIPFDFFFKNSLSQTLYYPDEIGLGGGVITGIQYFNNFSTNLPGKDVNIWMGETEMSDLSDGWVDPSTLQLVYSGTIDFLSGINDIFIPFDDVYVYGGGNLVVYTHRVWEDQYFSIHDRFYGTLDPESSRTRRASADAAVYDPAAPPDGFINHWHPNTQLYFSTAGLGAIEGLVTENGTPVEGVHVQIEGTHSSALTDAEGFFTFPFVSPGTYNLHFTKFGYQDAIRENVLVVEDEVTEVDIQIEAVPVFTVTGTVEGNDGLLVPGAQITMTGYDEYEVETDASGQFVIEDVFEGVYEVHITADGYDPYMEEGIMVDDDVELTFTMIETLVPPFGLQVQTEGLEPGEALLTWNPTGNGDIFFEGFEGAFPPAGWHKMNPDGGTGWMQLAVGTAPLPGWNVGEAIAAPDGDDFMAYASWEQGGTAHNDQWLITPEMTADEGFEFSFYLRYFPDSYDDNVDIRISTTVQDDVAAFDVIVDELFFTTGSSENWELYTYSVTDFVNAGETFYVAFREHVTDNFNMGSAIMLDNVYYGPAKSRAIPEPLVLDEITLEREFHRNLDYLYEPVTRSEKAFLGFNVYLDDDMVAPSIEENEYLFTGLEDGAYIAGVQSVYTTGTSDIVEIVFNIGEIQDLEVSFSVEDQFGNSVDDAIITLGSVTNDPGDYEFIVNPGTYNYTVSKEGYSTVEGSVQVLNDDVSIDIVLEYFILDLPWAEDFTGVTVGEVPEFWARTHTNWGVWNTSNAGGVAPELRFNWTPSATDVFRAITPPLNALEADALKLAFNHMVNDWSGGYSLKVQASLDEGATWEDVWVLDIAKSEREEGANRETGGRDVPATLVILDLDDYAGEMFHLAFAFDGNSFNINQWYVDDIIVGDLDVFALTMMEPDGHGTVTPDVGEYLYLEDTEVIVSAVPGYAWVLDNWTINGQVASMSPTTTITMDEDKEVQAVFAVADDAFVLTMLEPEGQGTVVPGVGINAYYEDDVVDLIAEPAFGWLFSHWVGNVEDNESAETTITMNQDEEIQAVFVAIPVYEVSGTVIGNDGPAVAGAMVTLAGYDNYTVETGADGSFVIEDVYEGIYAMTIVADGYDTYADEIDVADDLDLGTITLIESIIPPANLAVDVDGQEEGNALLTWSDLQEREFRWDDGTAIGQLGSGAGTLNTVLGSVHRNNAVLNEMSWYLTSEGGPHSLVKVWVFGLNASGQPNPNDVLYEMASVPNVDNQWNTYEFSQPVEAPNGFLIGLSYVGFLGLGTDSGTDSEWPFQPNTHFFVGDVTTGNFAAIETLGDFNENFLIRAFGVDNGELTFAKGAEIADYTGTILPAGSLLSEPVITGTPKFNGAGSSSANKAFDGYRVYLNDVLVEEGLFEFEYLFTDLDEGDYTAGVQSVYTTGESEIITVEFEMVFGVPVTINVTTNSGDSPEGALVKLMNQDHAEFHFEHTVGSDGEAHFEQVRKGMYTLHVLHEDYHDYIVEDIDIQEPFSHTAELVEIIHEPFGLMVETEGMEPGQALFSWNNTEAEDFFEGFEGAFPPAGWHKMNPDGGTGWMQLDVGTTPLPGWNVGEAIAAPDGGDFMAYASWQEGGASHNDQWLVTPEMTAAEGFEFSFYLRYFPDSYDDNVDIRISTTVQDDVAAFDVIVDELFFTTGSSENWELYTYSITDFVDAGETFYVAFREHVTDNFNMGSAIMLDNVHYGAAKSRTIPEPLALDENTLEREFHRNWDYVHEPVTRVEKAFLGFNVYLNDNLVATEIAETEYLFTDLPEGEHTAGVQSVYTSGTSEIVTINFETEGVAIEFYTVTFNVMDDDGNAITDAIVTFDGHTYDAGHYVIDDVEEGTYAYSVAKDGYFTANGEIFVDDDKTVDVTLLIDVTSVISLEGNEINIYPNPVREMLYIEHGSKITDIRVVDILGQVVYFGSAETHSYELNVAGFNPGVYFIQVTTVHGVNTQRVQVSR